MTRHCQKRDFLTLSNLTREELLYLFQRTSELKQAQKKGQLVHTLQGKTLGMIFEKSSTRTRVSFEVGMLQLGGYALFLSSRDIQLGRGEPLADSARVLSRYLDAIMVRTFAQSNLEIMAKYATIPIINGLSDQFHPCQLLADIFTYIEHRGPIHGRKVAWIGDGNNMANSWILAAQLLDFQLVLACPPGYTPDPDLLLQVSQAGAKVQVVHSPKEAAYQADLLSTDVWTSMGQEAENEQRLRDFAHYQVDAALMSEAAKDALFMHCLPAHRGEEVTNDVLESPASVVWDEAENRLHVQKALLEWLIAPTLSA